MGLEIRVEVVSVVRGIEKIVIKDKKYREIMKKVFRVDY